MKRNLLIAAALLLVVGVGAAVFGISGRRSEWTTSSPQALAEFEKGLDARDKIYYVEARQHFAKALELDPGFLVAKYFLLASKDAPGSDPTADKLFQDLEKADLSGLNDRERFLIRYAVAGRSKDTAKTERILAEYAAKHPDDPFVLEREANLASARQEWPEAHRLLARLSEVAPNRVMAYNQLGYLEMGQGRFAEAQKMFETYRYIAPDQANPHDSLGELFTLLGRYPDAKRELDEALRIKPDFCASWDHLIRLALMQGDVAGARDLLARAGNASPCGASMAGSEACLIAVWDRLLAADWEGLGKAQQATCPKSTILEDPLQIWVALKAGRRDQAEAVEKSARERLAKVAKGAGRGYFEGFVAHIEGARLLSDGQPAQAAERFRFADRAMSYRALPMGLIKVFNKLALAQALTESGAREEGAAALAEARAVNPAFADRIDAIMGWRAGS